MVLLWFIALLGASVNFFVKYLNKKDSTNFNPKFWIEDNKIEVVGSLILLTLLMLIVTNSETIINYEDFFALIGLPEWIQPKGELVLSAVIGYYSNAGLYWLVKKKKNESKIS